MKKFIFLIMIAVLLTVAQMQAASAAQSDGYIHPNHYYAVSFDGEGDAIVRAQIDIENTLDHAISDLDFEIPGQAVIYKAVQENYYTQPNPEPYYDGQYAPSRSPDYYPGNRYSSSIDYTKTLTSDSTLLRIKLSKSIQRGESTSVVLFYKIPLYAKKDSLGNFQFDFRTIIDKDAILVQNMRVAVNVDSGLSLKGGEAKVDYRPNTGMGFVNEAAMSKMANVGVGTQEYRQYYSTIRSAGGLVKTASNVDAFESFHVKGAYGENYFLVNLPESLAWPVAALIIIGIAIVGGKAAMKKISLKGKAKIDASGWFGIGVISFGSAVAILVIDAVLFFIAQFIGSQMYSLEWLAIAVVLFGLIISAGLLFLPALYVSSKEGMLKGAAVFFLTIGFLIVLFISIGLIVSFLFRIGS